MNTTLPCRSDCTACCITPSVGSPMADLLQSKPAGVPCLHLDDALRCRLFDQPE